MNETAVPQSGKFSILNALRLADWLTPERVKLWATCFAIAWIFLLLFDAWAHSSQGVTDDNGEHIGRDFINYWAGAKLAVDGKAAEAYDLDAFHKFQQTLVGDASEWKMYSYPPVAMLMTLPLAFLPFIPALLLWSFLGIACCIRLLKLETGWPLWPVAAAAAIASPAALWNLVSGQNGYFTAAFFAGGLALLPRKPVIAGILLGLLSYKPQLGLLIPVALLAGGQWRCFMAAAATVTCLFLGSWAALGGDAWTGFLHQMTAVQGAILKMTVWHRMPTVYTSLKVLGFPGSVANAAQILSALGAAALVVMIWRGHVSSRVKAAALIIATFLATPYAWDYDMIALTFAVLWLAQEGQRGRFLPWEKITWLAVVLLPTPLMGMSQFMGFQPAPVILWGALLLVAGRARLEDKTSSIPSLS
ncbi:MAG: glycosyltransferase family 87 protein [Alphaproteobacteria bacterium]